MKATLIHYPVNYRAHISLNKLLRGFVDRQDAWEYSNLGHRQVV